MHWVRVFLLFILTIVVSSPIQAQPIFDHLDWVISTHNQLLSARESLRSSQLSVDLAVAEFYPSLNLNCQLFRQENLGQGSYPNSYQSATQLYAEAYLFRNGFFLFNQLALKQKELAYADLAYQKVGQELKARCLRMYLDYYLAFKNYELHHSQLQFYEKSLKLTEQAYSKGDKSKLECSVIRVEMDLEKDLIAQDELALSELYLQLDQDFPKILAKSVTPDIQIESYLTMGIATRNVSANLEIGLLRQSVEIADQKIKMSSSSAMPSFSVFFIKQFQNSQVSFSALQSDFFRESNNTIGFNLSMPLFDAKVGLETDKQIAQKNQFLYADQELQKKIKQNFRDQLAHFIQNTKRYAFLKEKLIQAKENCTTAEPLYQKGLISFLQFREYYLAEQRIRESLLNTEKLIFTSILELKQLTGGL